MNGELHWSDLIFGDVMFKSATVISKIIYDVKVDD